MSCLLAFGYGYVARHWAKQVLADDWKVIGTVRDESSFKAIQDDGAEPFLFGDDMSKILPDVTHILISIPPNEDGDVVLQTYKQALLAHTKKLKWLGYLSTTGVYGDHQGEWVDEMSDCNPTSERGKRRRLAEQQWLSLADELPAHVFRLTGIYGPGRSQLDRVRDGAVTPVHKPGHFMNRIHVEDICQVLSASVAKPNVGSIYNVSDDEPAPTEDIIRYCYELLGKDCPESTPFDKADLSPMAREFYSDNKQISNALIKEELGVALKYSSYRQGYVAQS